MGVKNFRKREILKDDDVILEKTESDGEEDRRLALEEVKFIQRQRLKKSGISAVSNLPTSTGYVPKSNDKNEGEAEKEELVLQDTFAQETAVMVEDPNMLKYVEQEFAKKRGKIVGETNQIENDLKSAEDELYLIPEHLKVKKRSSEEGSTQWTTGIAEVQLPIEYKLRNIEETEAAKRLLQERKMAGGGRNKSEANSNIPSSFSADFFQRGKDYTEKLRREHPEMYRGGGDGGGGRQKKQRVAAATGMADAVVGRRQAATDELMLERFRKRDRHRVMRR